MDFTFATPLAARTWTAQMSPWMGKDKENMGHMDGMSPFPVDLDLDKAYEDWMGKMEKMETVNSPLLQTATKTLSDLSKAAGKAAAKEGAHAGDALFNKWLTATEQLVFTPKTDLTSMRTPLCDTSANPPTPPVDILALKGHPLSQERTGVVPHVGAIGAGWYVRSPLPACAVDRRTGQRQPEFDSDSEDETPSTSHSGMDEEEDDEEEGHEGTYEGQDGEGEDVLPEDASFGYGSTHHMTDHVDGVSDMAVSQLGATMSQLKMLGSHADGMEMSPAPSALLHRGTAMMHLTPATPKTPVDKVIDLMVGNSNGAAAVAGQAIQPQLLDFGAAAAPAAVGAQQPQLQLGGSQGGASEHEGSMGGFGYGVDAVQYQQYSEEVESSDDEVDVASLGFTPLSLSTAARSPISDVIALMMSPGEVEPLD